MKIKLLEHQEESIKKLKSGSILWGGVGSGKTIASIAYFIRSECQGDFEPFVKSRTPKDLYIITTAQKRDKLEWEKEAAYFALSKTRDDSRDGIKVTVDSWNNIQKYKDINNAFFIFDEQRLVGYGAWVKAFLKISRKNRWILLSATPGDTWMDYMPVFLANGFYKNKTEFIGEHVVYARYVKFPKIDKYINTGKLNKLRRQVLVEMPFKKETKQIHKYVMTEHDSVEYSKVNHSRWDIYDEVPIDNATKFCYILRKVSNTHESRAVELEKIIRHHARVIIFYNFNYELEILRELADRIEIVYSEWNGHKHEQIPNTNSWLYLVQYTSGAEGWNCISTDTIVFYSQNYSYKIMHQAAGRIDRLNTPYETLYYYHLITDSKIDESIRQAIKNKKIFNTSTFLPFHDSRG